MGLAIVYTILKEYYGTIHVESEKGKGTIVHIYLPTISFHS
jgi:signal transduction histidine kinase